MDIRGFEVLSTYEGKDIHLPERKTAESAGYDIEAAESLSIAPHTFGVVKTGLKAFMGHDEYLAIHIRSSLAFKRGLMLVNSTGIIDSDYYNNSDNEGHIMIGLFNWGDTTAHIEEGERIAQGIFTKYLIANEDEASAERVGGFGSTGTR